MERCREEEREMWISVICIGSSIVTSAVVTKILATRYFKIVDGYVNDICENTKEFVDNIKN